MKPSALALLIALLCVAGGCTPSYSFKVWVRNDTPKPIMIWLTKDGPPVEDNWLSPEQLARTNYDLHAVVGGASVPPGAVAQTPDLSGHFEPGTHAVLRIYRGQLRMAEILAVDSSSPNRLDVVLHHTGSNRIVVTTDAQGHLLAGPPSDNK